MRSYEDWKREQFKKIRVRAAYSAQAVEFACARIGLVLRRKKHAEPSARKNGAPALPITPGYRGKHFVSSGKEKSKLVIRGYGLHR